MAAQLAKRISNVFDTMKTGSQYPVLRETFARKAGELVRVDTFRQLVFTGASFIRKKGFYVCDEEYVEKEMPGVDIDVFPQKDSFGKAIATVRINREIIGDMITAQEFVNVKAQQTFDEMLVTVDNRGEVCLTATDGKSLFFSRRSVAYPVILPPKEASKKKEDASDTARVQYSEDRVQFTLPVSGGTITVLQRIAESTWDDTGMTVYADGVMFTAGEWQYSVAFREDFSFPELGWVMAEQDARHFNLGGVYKEAVRLRTTAARLDGNKALCPFTIYADGKVEACAIKRDVTIHSIEDRKICLGKTQGRAVFVMGLAPANKEDKPDYLMRVNLPRFISAFAAVADARNDAVKIYAGNRLDQPWYIFRKVGF
jgi:hypothetical protein